MKHLVRIVSIAAAASAISLGAAPLYAQSTQPLTIVVPYPPGGSSDRAARLLAEALQSRLGETVIVENRAGAGGRLAAQQLKRDGATSNILMLANPAIMVVAPLVFKDTNYDPERDFQPVAQVTRYEFAVAVGPAVPVREFRHLLAWMKANPDKANLGVPATGSLPHFFGLMLGEKSGVKAPVVGYKGSAPLLQDLIGGHVPVALDTLDTLQPQHEGGKLRVLATSGARRSAELPDVPTFKEIGFDLIADGWNVLYAPSSMPAERVARLSTAIATTMSDPALQAKFVAAKMVPVSADAKATAKMLAGYRAQWAPVVKRSGFQQ